MKRLLLLARGDGGLHFDLSGESILKNFPMPLVVLAEKTNARQFQGLGDNVVVEIVRYYDIPGIHACVQRLANEPGLLGIAALSEEVIELAAELREKLNLPGMRPAEAQRFRNKLLMKEALSTAGIRVPENIECIDRKGVERLLAKHHRLVIKPVDGFGSKEVEFVQSATELDAWYGKGKKLDEFEAEEYIDGTLYHLNALVRDGEILLTACAPYLPGMGNIDFSSGTPLVSAMLTSGELRDRFEAFSTQAIQVLGLRDGVTHMECFLKNDGEIVFCEVGARPGGGGIVLMIEAQYGINFPRASLLLQGGLGDQVTLDPGHPGKVVGLMGFRYPHSCFIERIAPVEAFNEDWIHHVRIHKQAGDFVAGAAHCTDYIGLLIFSAADFAEFETQRLNLYQRFYSSLETKAV